MGNRFAGRTAVVTGGGGGIGRETAATFARDGANVAILDLDIATAQAAAEAIAAEHGVKAMAFECDVADPARVDATFDEIVKQLGGLDILVNNAGVTRDNLIFKMQEDDWDTVMNVHLRGAFVCSRAAQRVMVDNAYGKIVNISSTSALGNRGQVNYSTAKAGLQGFTRTLALELGRYNINVNCVAPGFIDTEMTRASARRRGFDPEDFKAERAKNIAVRRVGKPEDVANVVAFLCSDEAGFVSGQIVYVSGGPETRR
ncbi:3-oxoacyl-ACP reductase FabG [Oceanibacterium hippocampi]|uniref:3-oxoacyl-[acyl-carrier-protein] reductase FabG n=1 Tax=Oceanibacterium hippocampi TaxID=745714 RepID=A0A1Y5TH54_9PROT|nr:3-oxoacyl-ACP reductase FabG [Oceanibacterium hippocampi]SLN63777.1 3-oxoacyl-[acyl-carrier-protein] reductase FabG [Oceanibacterium hippocampi]